MMSRIKHVLGFVVLTCVFMNCKENNFPFKYEDKPEPFECNLENGKIFKEALYSFENDLTNYYKGSDTLEKAYEVLINSSEGNTINRVAFTSGHTISVFRELKKMEDLWVNENSENLEFNYKHPIFKCIGDAIKDEEFKKTYNVLRENNSFNSRLLISAIKDRNIAKKASNDKALAMYISLDYCFHQMTHMFIPKVKY